MRTFLLLFSSFCLQKWGKNNVPALDINPIEIQDKPFMILKLYAFSLQLKYFAELHQTKRINEVLIKSFVKFQESRAVSVSGNATGLRGRTKDSWGTTGRQIKKRALCYSSRWKYNLWHWNEGKFEQKQENKEKTPRPLNAPEWCTWIHTPIWTLI